MSSATHQPDIWYEQLLSVSQQAASIQHFEIAYHSLAATMQCALAMKDVQRLKAVLHEAQSQKQALDTGASDHPLSSSSAHQRGHESVYSSLQQQLITHIRFLDTQQNLQTMRTRLEQSNKT